MNKMDKILIIGGCGYIGCMLTTFLKNKYKITIIDINYIDINIFDDITIINENIKNIKPNYFNDYDIIIYIAGNSSVKSSKNLYSTIENNIDNLMYIIKSCSYQKIIYASSSSVYGNTNKNIVDETFDNIIPHNYYDMSKKTLDDYTKIINNNSNKKIFGLRFGTVNGYSPNFRNDIMINAMVNNAINNNIINIYSENTKRPILGLKDLCRAIETIIINGNENNKGLYNLASFNSSSGEIGKEISKILNVEYNILETPKIITNCKLETSSYNFHINCKKFENNFNFIFNDNIESIVYDIKNNYKKIIKNSQRIQDNYYNYINKYKEINVCRVCNNSIESILNLYEQPLANNYLINDYIIQDKYPLNLMLCKKCFHLQLNTVVNPNLLYRNYIYTSGTSNTLIKYFNDLANKIINNTKKNGTILEIACNDGSQLNIFKEKGWTTIGIDPAKNLYSKSSINNDIYCDFLNEKICKSIKEKYTEIDVILAQNVFAHTDDINEFINSCKLCMNNNTKLYIQVSQANLVREKQFDTVYHEHLSFFNINSMNYFMNKHNLFINNISKPSIHGVSYLFEIGLVYNKNSNLAEMLNEEQNIGLTDELTYQNYSLECKNKAINFKMKIYEEIKNGFTIIGYGASAKGNTLLNYLKLNYEIECIIDDNISKQNLYTPGSNILICDKNKLKNYDKVAILMITWNFKDEIMKKVKEVRGEKETTYIFY